MRLSLTPNRPALCTTVLCIAVISAGCASNPNKDPLEAANRKVFAFNEGVDKVVLKPMAKAYQAMVPDMARTGVSNFFSNLQEPWTAANLLLQGSPGASLDTLARFGTNTTVGMLGVMDPATKWGMKKRNEDFGLTLDTWGIGTGSYLVLPLLGSSNVRDLASFPMNSMGNPTGQVSDVSTKNTLTVLSMVSKRAQYLPASELADQVALDKYTLMRDAHMNRRNRAQTTAEVEAAVP